MKDEMRANKLTEFLSETTRRVSVDETLPPAPWIWYILSILFWAAVSAGGIVYSILFVDPIYTDGIIYGGILFVISVGSIILDACDAWKCFQEKFEECPSCCCCGWAGKKLIKFFAVLFFFISLAAWIIMSIEEENVIDRTTAIDATIWTTFYLGVAFLFLTLLSGWEMISYYFAENSWLQGFMWISIIGGAVLQNARLLRPPNEHIETWHKKHDIQDLLKGILFVVNLSWLAFVVLTCLCVPLFAEVSRWAAGVGVGVGIAVYITFAFVITLNPIAPGTAIDVCGGFIFIILFMEGWNWTFYTSYLVGLAIIIAIHYISACMQWILGKVHAVQLWMNRNSPIFILAASDAVLDDAGWIKVGLVGYVFLDTLNGLNQGRINMEFWTQLLSEWSCIPAAISLSMLGASVAVQGNPDHSWTSVAVPMLIIVSGVVAAAGSIIGAHELGNSTDKKGFWHNREKWCIVQHFLTHGLACTKLGWERDIFQIASTRDRYNENVEESQLRRDNCLIAKVYPAQLDFIARRDQARTDREKATVIREYQATLTRIREIHYEKILMEVDNYKNLGLMIQTHDPDGDSVKKSFWSDSGTDPGQKAWKLYLQYFVVSTLVLAFWGGIVGFFLDSDTAVAVEKGVDVFKDVHWMYWCTLAYFGIVYNLYIWEYWVDQVMSIASTMRFVLGCCQSEGDLETRFPPLPYTIPAVIEADTLQKLKEKYGASYSLADEIEHEGNYRHEPVKSKSKRSIELA